MKNEKEAYEVFDLVRMWQLGPAVKTLSVVKLFLQ